jgi:CTP-dependent riboflavin kinase
MRAMAEELKMPHRQIHPKLGVPISTTQPPIIKEANEKTMLAMLAEDYRVNPGLYMSLADMKQRLIDVTEEQLNKILIALETKRLVKLHRDKRGSILLAKATYIGLKKAKPKQYYQYYPEWIDKKLLF